MFLKQGKEGGSGSPTPFCPVDPCSCSIFGATLYVLFDLNSNRKTTKINRAIVGASLEEIKKKRSQKPEVRSAQREAAAK